MKTVLLGITGSIAAYKAADITNILTNEGYNVEVIMTKGAREFITPLTMQTLSKNRVNTDVFQEMIPQEVRHIALAQKADLLLVAPASADIIGKLANGIADDMLTSIALALGDIPKLVAPAMNTRMYENPIVQENLSRMERFGFAVIPPREARLACGDLGKGALAEIAVIIEAVNTACPRVLSSEQAKDSIK